MELWAALLGAVIGGMATFAASSWQTRQVLTHEREQAREAALEERRAARESMTRSMSYQLLTVLADVDHVVPRLAGGPSHLRGEREARERWEHERRTALDGLSRMQASIAPLMPKPAQDCWHNLRMLVVELALAPADWGDSTIARARQDVEDYLGYVRATIVAIIDGTDLPPVLDPPVLARKDEEASQASVGSP